LRFSDELIREIIRANDLCDYVSRYVKLKRSGNSLVGLCPFHSEKTPSFHVSPDKQLFYCFGCGKGGTVLQFVMNIENLDFIDALTLLAENARIPLPAEEDQNDEAYQKKKLLYKINKDAAEFYHEYLLRHSPPNVREYVKMRGLNAESIQTFMLGYAPKEWDVLTKYLLSKKYDKELLVLSNLSKVSKNGTLYDTFRNRLMFPIVDVRGNFIAFGGRILEGEGPKYLNSADSPIFNKSYNLYALNIAKNTTDPSFILVEGYLDVISLHQHGFKNAVATLGTSLTQQQAKLISRYKKEVYIAYDSDDAGIKAANRALGIFENEDIKVKIIHLDKKDPDEFLKKHGRLSFQKEKERALSGLEYTIHELKKKYNLENLDEKIEFLNKASEILAKVSNKIEQEAYIKRLSAECGISEESIYAEIKKRSKREEKKELKREVNAILNSSKPGEKDRQIKAERALLSLILSDINVYTNFKDILTEDFFDHELHKMIIKKIIKSYKDGEIIDTALIINSFSPELSGQVAQILGSDLNFEKTLKGAEDLIRTVKLEKVQKQIDKALIENDMVTLQKLLTLQKQLKGGTC